jgi:hypothetical protein
LNPRLGVDKFMVEVSGLKSLALESSRLKSPGLKGLVLKLGVEKSGVEMSFNRFICKFIFDLSLYYTTISFLVLESQ